MYIKMLGDVDDVLVVYDKTQRLEFLSMCINNGSFCHARNESNE